MPYYLEFNALTGGASGALDSLNTTSLANDAHARVDTGADFYTYVYDSTSILAENSPFVIAPDTGSGRWILSNHISKYDTGQNLLSNSAFKLWSNSTLENIGNQISVSDITAGVCTTTETETLTEGKLVEFGAGGSTANKVYQVTAVTNDTSFTINDTSITDATAVTCYESTPACIAENSLGPDGWYKTSTLKLHREHNGDNTKDGSFYALRVENGSNDLEELRWPLASIHQNDYFYKKFSGRTVVYGCWYLAYDEDNVRLVISDGVGGSQSSYHTGSGLWEWLEVSRTIDEDNTRLLIVDYFNAGSGNIAYKSQPVFKFGSVIGEGNYQPERGSLGIDAGSITLTDYSSASVSANIDIDIESQTKGKIGKGFKALNMSLAGLCSTTDKYLSLGPDAVIIQSNVSSILNRGQNTVWDYDNDGKIQLSRDDTFTDVEIKITGVEL